MGFYDGYKKAVAGREKKYDNELGITLDFGKYDANQEGIKEIQRGVLDFVEQYRLHFGDKCKLINSVKFLILETQNEIDCSLETNVCLWYS